MADSAEAAASSSSKQEDPVCPKGIKLGSDPVDVCCHPQKDIVASCDIDGLVYLHSYSTKENNHELFKLTHHKKAGRAVRFAPSGLKLFTASKDKSIQMVNLDTGAVELKLKKAHEDIPYSMLAVDDNILVSGDDEGTLKVWDMRQKKSIMELKENDDFISDMKLDKYNRLLVATSGDGTLTAFDIRKHKMKMQSELFDSDLLCCAVVKGGQKVVCGSGDGSLNIFNWGEWGNMSDRLAGHPESVDCMAKLSDEVILTGSTDGIIRAVNIAPNRFLGVIGEHEDDVTNMSVSHCKNYLLSCSHDELIHFWDVSDVLNEKVDTSKKAKKSHKNKVINKQLQKDDFFADLAEEKPEEKEDEDNDDSDNDEWTDDDNNMEQAEASDPSSDDDDDDDEDKS